MPENNVEILFVEEERRLCVLNKFIELKDVEKAYGLALQDCFIPEFAYRFIQDLFIRYHQDLSREDIEFLFDIIRRAELQGYTCCFELARIAVQSGQIDLGLDLFEVYRGEDEARIRIRNIRVFFRDIIDKAFTTKDNDVLTRVKDILVREPDEELSELFDMTLGLLEIREGRRFRDVF